MRNILLIFLLGLFLTTSVFARLSRFPAFPSGCFDQNVYCSTADVVEKIIHGKKQKVIQVNIFLMASSFDFSSTEEILSLFFDFDSWDEYVASEGSGTVRFNNSLNLGSIIWNNHQTYRHYAHYSMKAPFPINYSKVRAVGYYWHEAPIQGALASCYFENQTEGTFEIPGEDPLIGGEGFKYTAGEFHIRQDENTGDFTMFFTADVIPEISFLPSVAAPYVHAGFLAILKGMFDL